MPCPKVERLTFVPKQAMATDVYFSVIDRDTGELVSRNKTTLLTTNRTAGGGKTATMLVIGDSYVFPLPIGAWSRSVD